MPSGNFCERHGPYDTPNKRCPYCEREDSVGVNEAGTPSSQRPISPEEAPIQHPPPVAPLPEYIAPPAQPQAPPPASQEPLDGFGYGADQHIDFINDETVGESPPAAAPQPMGPLAFLLVQRPLANRGQVITLLPGNVIGRKKADVILPDRKVSRQHARINLEPPDENGQVKFAIFDFGTSNGTHVNDHEISGRQVLEENDEIRLGDHTFIFKTLV